MLLREIPLVFVLAGLMLYAILGGADFGAGFWQLFAGPGKHGARIREHAHRSLAPVWEANHVWLIFVLTVFWTAYPEAFGAIATSAAAPLFIALIGIIFRGAAYAARAGARTSRESGRIDTVFSISSILTPYALGSVVGAIAADQIMVSGEAQPDLTSVWVNPTSIAIGLLAVTNCAFLAAVYLAAAAAQTSDQAMERSFRRRALGSGAAGGLVALAGLVVIDSEDGRLARSLFAGSALVAVIASLVAGCATLLLVHRRRYNAARCSAAGAVATVLLAWVLARWPIILPGLSATEAAAGHQTLVWVVAAVLGGAVVLFPALGLLFRLTLTGRFASTETSRLGDRAGKHERPRLRLAALASSGFLIAGIGLLNFADGDWAHSVGVICLLGFAITVFVGIASDPTAEG
jgi:cytochrome d ubiquinol oxidase subunit II